MEGKDGWKIKKKLEIAEAKKVRNNETRRRKTLLKVGSGTGAIMAGDLNRKDGFLAEIEGPSHFSKRKKETNTDDQNISENNPQEIVLEQVNVSESDCWSELQLSHNRTSRLRSTILEKQIKDFEAELQASECIADDIVDTEKNSEQKQGKKWSSRQHELDEDFSEKREDFFKCFIEKNSIPIKSFCAECERPVVSCVIKCSTCKDLLCGNCDFQCHFKRPFHIRELFNNEELSSRFLLPEEFIGVGGIVQAKAVPVPLFVPSQCSNCNEYGTLTREAGSRPLAIITKDGRFDLHSTNFRCRKCENTVDASNETFISSGYFPSTAKKATCYFAEDLSIHWHHFQHLSPSTSVRKYVESLEEVTKERGGYGTINRTHFSRVGKEFEYFRHKISTTVLSCRIMYCEACGEYILAVHVDGNFKLYRWINSSQYQSPSLFGNDVFQWCEDRRDHENEINSVKPLAKKKDTCGTSTYAAGRAESSKKKNIDVTGVLMGSCRHGVILGATDLEKGESYRAVHFLLTKMPAKFICQDVICHFWKFADDVGSLIKKYEGITANSTPFLSRWHGKTHAWYCQVLWLGHWKKKSAATLGEEQEQGFAYFSSLALKTKRMDRGSRRDSMSSSVLYFNAKKNRKMAATLSKRLKKAWKLAPCLRTKLDEMLKERNVTEDQLPLILKNLQEKAINHQDNLTTSNLPLDYERNQLEGLHMALQRFKKRIESEAVTAKERTKIRGYLRKVKEDAEKCIMAFNSALPQVLAECIKRDTNKKSKEGDGEIKKWKLISVDDFSDGIFPWQSLGGTIKNDFELIDVWMLWQRYEEEIPETEKEMNQYIEYLTTRKNSVHQEILEKETSLALADNAVVERGKLFLLKREYQKINDRRLLAVKTFSALIDMDSCDDDEYDESSDDEIDENEMSDDDS